MVAMPMGLACWILGIPIFLVEPNIRAGMANKILSQFAEKAFSVPESDARIKFKCTTLETGNPVVGKFSANEIRKTAQNILVLGGSQGARILCDVTLRIFSKLITHGFRGKLLLQSGEKNLEDAMQLKQTLKLGAECEVAPFILDMAAKLAWADVVIARAGAMTLTEVALAQVPSLLIPFPSAADDHQRVNAKILADRNAAIVVEEKDKAFEANLEQALWSLVNASSYSHRKILAQHLGRFAKPQAAREIVSEILISL